MNLVDVECSKSSLGYDLSCVANLDVLAADVLAESRPHGHDSNALVKTHVDEQKLMLPLIDAHGSEDIKRFLLRAGSMLGQCAIDFGAYLMLPMGIQGEEA